MKVFFDCSLDRCFAIFTHLTAKQARTRDWEEGVGEILRHTESKERERERERQDETSKCNLF
jgi:hypothetical protein